MWRLGCCWGRRFTGVGTPSRRGIFLHGCWLMLLDVLVSPCLPTSMQMNPPTSWVCVVLKIQTPCAGGGLCCRCCTNEPSRHSCSRWSPWLIAAWQEAFTWVWDLTMWSPPCAGLLRSWSWGFSLEQCGRRGEPPPLCYCCERLLCAGKTKSSQLDRALVAPGARLNICLSS